MKMFTTFILSLLSVCHSAGVLEAAGWEGQVKWELEHGCFISARQRAIDEYDASRSSAILKELDDKVANLCASEKSSVLDRYYSRGYRAWREGDFLTARNFWFKYLKASAQVETVGNPYQLIEVDGYFQICESELEIEPPAAMWDLETESASPKETEGNEATEGQPVLRKNRMPRQLTGRSERLRKRPSLSAEQLKEKAARAHRDGQLEYAIRLYELADKLEPNSADTRKKIDSVERELN